METETDKKNNNDKKYTDLLDTVDLSEITDDNDAEHEPTTSSPQATCNKKKLDNQGFDYCMVIAALVLIIAVIAVLPIINSKLHLRNKNAIDILDLQKKYPLQSDDLFRNIEIILNDIVQLGSQRPAVFLLLYMQNNNSVINDIVHDLALYASEKMQIYHDYIELNETEFYLDKASFDYGFLIHKYKPELEERAVMVVKELQNIPAHGAQIFHSFCDDESPLVGRAVYIFTMKVNSFAAKEEYIAESHLKQNWKSLDNDILIPLIARVTSTVLKIYS